MGEGSDSRTKIERVSGKEFVVRRTFNAPARIVFRAWTTPDLFKQWWAPKSLGMPLLSVEQDVRVGGGYRVEFSRGGSQTLAFFGTYIEVVPDKRLVWTNEEGPDGPVTTVTFEEKDGATLLVLREVYPSEEALDASGGAEGGYPEQFAQLDELLAALS